MDETNAVQTLRRVIEQAQEFAESGHRGQVLEALRLQLDAAVALDQALEYVQLRRTVVELAMRAES